MYVEDAGIIQKGLDLHVCVSIADGIFQLNGPGDLKYEVWSNAKLKVNILIDGRNCIHASILV